MAEGIGLVVHQAFFLERVLGKEVPSGESKQARVLTIGHAGKYELYAFTQVLMTGTIPILVRSIRKVRTTHPYPRDLLHVDPIPRRHHVRPQPSPVSNRHNNILHGSRSRLCI
jgi:hypothetical protein